MTLSPTPHRFTTFLSALGALLLVTPFPRALALPPEILEAAQSPESDPAAAWENAPEPDFPAFSQPDFLPFLDARRLPQQDSTAVSWSTLFTHSQIQHGVQINWPNATQAPTPFSLNATVPFRPASNTKLYSLALGLQALGPEYQFETQLQWQRPTPDSTGTIVKLTVIGSGDPSWGLWDTLSGTISEIEAMAQGLAQAGVKRVVGPIQMVAGDTRWNQLRYPRDWQSDDIPECYGALPQAFNLQVNCATFIVRSLTRGEWQEPGIAMPVTVSLKRTGSTSLRVKPVLDSQGVPKSYTIQGTISRTAIAAGASLRLPVIGTATWAKNVLVAALLRAGISYEPKATIRLSSQKLEAQSLSFFSRPLREILKPFMKDSINLIGDAIFRKAGEATDAPDLWDGGKKAMDKFLAEIQTGNAVFYDGSGLSYANRVQVPDLVTILRHLRARPDFSSTVWDTFPIAGIDGTLKERMVGTVAQGVLRGKTGTLTGAYNLSGFVPVLLGNQTIDYVPFVFLSETTKAYRLTTRSTQDQAGVQLTRLLNPTLTAPDPITDRPPGDTERDLRIKTDELLLKP